MSYIYGKIEDAKIGDIVECVNDRLRTFTKGKLYILTSNYSSPNASLLVTLDDAGSTINGFGNSRQCRLVLTKPGSEAKEGDEVIRFKGGTDTCPTGTVFTVLRISNNRFLCTTSLSADNYECLVLCKAENTSKPRVALVTRDNLGHPVGSKIVEVDGLWKLVGGNGYRFAHTIGDSCEWLDELPTKRNIAYYKRSELPWTEEELTNIIPDTLDYSILKEEFKRKYVFDMGDLTNYMYFWTPQEKHNNFKNCIQIAYEDIFGDSNIPCTISETKQPETVPSAPTIQTQQKENNMNDIKIEINGKAVALCGQTKPVKVKTDLQLTSKYITIWYDTKGALARQTEESAKKAKKELQKPVNLGFTYRTYEISESATTDIPVVNIAV